MKRTGSPLLMKLTMLSAALALAAVLSVSVATPLQSEAGGAATEEAGVADRDAAERPVAVARGFNDASRADVRSEPAVSPELRKLRLKMAQRRKAEQQRAQRQAASQEAARREAARQEAERREAARARAEQRKLEQEKAERRRIEREKAEAARKRAEKAAEARKLRSLPAGAAGRTAAGQGRSAPSKSKPGSTSAAPGGGKMALSIQSIGLRNKPIEVSDQQSVLDRGLIHLPQTSRPWERGKSRNVYVVGHRMGWPGTKSWKIFYRVPELQRGDEIVLTAGTKTHRYRVSEKLVVTPWDVWVTDPVKGRDLLSLQTCVGPNFSQRMIVRADRI
ncbi:hypothetical protein BH23ACT11_BH23ACT11_28180 [soil metagenome]